MGRDPCRLRQKIVFRERRHKTTRYRTATPENHCNILKRTLYILSLIALLMAAFILGKIEFLAYNRDITFFSMHELLRAIRYGLPLDAGMVALMVMPVWLITLLTMKWKSMPLRWIAGTYLAIATFATGFITGGGIVMYENWKFPVDASIFSYMSSPGNAGASASTYYIITRGGLVLLSSALMAFLTVVLTPRRIEEKNGRGGHRRQRKGNADTRPIPFLLTGLLLCLMMWGITGKRLDERSAFHSDKLLLNHAALNPMGHMLRSLWFYRQAPEKQFAMMDRKECDRIFTGIFPTDTEDITDTLLRTKRPDILTIQLESMGAPFMESLGGAKNVTPELDAWMERGINFTNAWANSFRTDRGTVSVLSGYVSYPTVSLMMTDSCLAKLPSLAKTLGRYGYTADYLYGGNAHHMNKRKYLEAVGFRVWDIEDIDVSKSERDTWGANDSIAMNRVLRLIQQTKRENGPDKPFYWGCQTISSHEPWEVPYKRLDNKVYNAFAYTDHCVGQLLDSLSRTPLWDNLLVILFADHGHTYGLTMDNPEFFHIPIFMVGGALCKTKKTDLIMAQNDIVATLLSQMGIPHNEEFPWSRNVLSHNYTYPSAYCNYPAGALLVDSSGRTLMDVPSEYILVDEPQPSETRQKNLKVMLQKSYETIP